MIGQSLVNVTSAIFIGYMRVNLKNVTILIWSVVKGLVSSVLVVLGFGLTGAILGHVISYLVAGMIALMIALNIVREIGRIGFPSMGMLRELLSFSLPIYLSSLTSGGLTQLTSAAGCGARLFV